MKGIIIYKTKYGTAKKYADLISEKTKFDVVELSKFNKRDIKNYNTIIFCSSIYMSSISGISFIRKNYNELKTKKIAIFAVGASLSETKFINNLKKCNLKSDLKNVPLFYGRGKIDKEKLTFKDKTLLKILRKMISRQDPKTYNSLMKIIMSLNEDKCDWINKEYLKPLLKYIKNNE